MPFRIGIQVYKPGGRKQLEALADFAAAVQALLALQGILPPIEEEPPVPDPTPGPIDPSRPITVPEGTPPRELSDLIMAHFPRDAWVNAARVSFHESDWNRIAERNTLPRAGGRCSVQIGTLPDGTPIVSEDSVGYFQINICAHRHDREYWRDAANNVAYAASLYRTKGWWPWVYTAKKLHLI